MPGKSDFLEAGFLNHLFRTASLPKGSSVYVSLHTADPGDANTATELTIGSFGYSRVAVTVGDAQWAAPSASGADMQTSNAVAIAFGTPSGNWASGNPITHFGIYDAATAGNLLYSGALGTSRVVLSGDNPPSFAVGALVIKRGECIRIIT